MMKRVVVSFFVTILMVMVVTTSAQKSGPRSMFTDQKKCDAALASGNYSIYQPVDLSKKNQNAIDGVKIFGVKHEAATCRHQVTMKGWKWVIVAEGTTLRATKNPDGELVVFARDDCGNADDTDKVKVALPTVAKEPSVPITDKVKVALPTVAKEPSVPTDGPVRLACPHNMCGVGTASKLNLNLKEELQREEGSSKTPTKHHHWVWATVVGGGAAVALVFLLKEHKSTPTGVVPPGGNTGPAF